MVLLAEDDWFYASPTQSSAPPARTFGTSKPAWETQKNAVKDAEEHHMPMANTSASLLIFAFVALTSALPAVERAVV